VPRVETKKRNKGGKRTYQRSRCQQDILAGEEYYTWAFRYGGRRWRHVKCGYPRQSELTQSLMSDVYATIEMLEDLPEDAPLEDLVSAMQDISASAEDVAQQYRDAAEHFGGEGENAERADELENWQSEVENAASELESLISDAADESELPDPDEVAQQRDVATTCPL
jgi:hypothetical protein